MVLLLMGCGKQENIIPISGNINESMSNTSKDNNEGNDIITNQEYTIITAIYTSQVISEEDIINVKYPQITGLGDPVKEQKINDLIMNDLIENEIEYFAQNFMDGDVYDLELDYQITMQTPEILSILFQGNSKYCTGIGAGFSNARDSYSNTFNIYAMNIDLLNVEKLELTDFTKIDTELFEKLKQSTDYTNPLLEGGFITKEELYRMMPKQYSGLTALIEGEYYNTFCITSDAYIISVGISPIVGGYVLIKIPREIP